MSATVKIREINPHSDSEIALVAQRMRQTLVEVLGEERGTSMYSMEWLIERVRWHLNSNNTHARIFLSENQNAQITGQAIARIEIDDDGSLFGYFSTVFVDPKRRRKGIAKSLLGHVENWLRENKMPRIVYNTAENHIAIITLFSAHGYEITHLESEMIQLTKTLSAPLSTN